MSYDKIIKNGRLVIPKEGIVDAALCIRDGKIAAIVGDTIGLEAREIIDATGKHILPGVIDPHVHMGYTASFTEQCESETRSAAIGGITTVLVYTRAEPFTKEVITERRLEAEKLAYIDFSFQLMVTSDEQVNRTEEVLRESGISSFKFLTTEKPEAHISGIGGMAPPSKTINVFTDGFFYDALTQLAQFGRVVANVHAENFEVIERLAPRVRSSGEDGLPAWNHARPDFTEAEAIHRVCYFSEVTGCPVYIVHISSKLGVEELSQFKRKNIRVFGETCPHYLVHNIDSHIGRLGKVNPPLRTKADNEVLWQALANGELDTIGSDTAAMKAEKKQDIWSALPGCPGAATLLPILLSEGVHKKRLSLERVVEVTSYNAANIFNLYPRKGTIMVGSDADLAIIDLNLEKIVSPELEQSYSDFSIYDGWKVKGWPVMTLVRGTVVMQDGQIVGPKGYGQFIKRNAFLSVK